MTSTALNARQIAEQLTRAFVGAPSLDQLVWYRSDYHGAVTTDNRADWTNALLNCLLEQGRSRGLKVYPTRRYLSRDRNGGRNSCYDHPRRQDDEGEHLVDACWTTYPPNWPDGIEDMPEPPRVALAAEVEWGSLNPTRDVSWHDRLILDDFAKVIDVRAEAKLLIGSYFDQADCDGLIKRTRSLARGDLTSSYAIILWPWNASFASRAVFKMETW